MGSPPGRVTDVNDMFLLETNWECSCDARWGVVTLVWRGHKEVDELSLPNVSVFECLALWVIAKFTLFRKLTEEQPGTRWMIHIKVHIVDIFMCSLHKAKHPCQEFRLNTYSAANIKFCRNIAVWMPSLVNQPVCISYKSIYVCNASTTACQNEEGLLINIRSNHVY